MPPEWSDLDERAISVSRALVLDAVENSGGGHAGSAVALAPVFYMLYQKILRHNPADPDWEGRDRFVLSCGHLSLGQYVQLHLSGYSLTLEDLRRFRQHGSITPSHPEYGLTPGVEMSTGPLGQGLASAVGMAMALARRYPVRSARGGEEACEASPRVWVLASDGDIQEGVTSEASSLAGHLRLGCLNVIYDRNRVTTDGDSDLSLSEDVGARYKAYGWQVLHVPDVNDSTILYQMLQTATANTTAPTLIIADTTIAWPAPNAMGKASAHGGPLGTEEVWLTKERLRLPPDKSFYVPTGVLEHTTRAVERGNLLEERWRNYQRIENLGRTSNGSPSTEVGAEPSTPICTTFQLPRFEGSAMSTRAASGAVLNSVATQIPELWGGSADLGANTFTLINDVDTYVPLSADTNSTGRNVHFGVREHAMGAILNGIALCGDRPYGGTFLVFSDYMRPAIRMAALMGLPVIYVLTHDSVAIGEDGPTHQPIEHLASLRAVENLDVIRPADANETASAWRQTLRIKNRPVALVLSRQALPILPVEGTLDERVARGAYVLVDPQGQQPAIILIASGSEVHLAMSARAALEQRGLPTRVVSIPCREWFDEQDHDYRESVLPRNVKARVSIEAGVAQGWREIVGEDGEIVSIRGYGASADGGVLYAEKGFTVARVVERAETAHARTQR